jgi:hypothetical protein
MKYPIHYSANNSILIIVILLSLHGLRAHFDFLLFPASLSVILCLCFGSRRVTVIVLAESYAFPAVTSQLDSRLAGAMSCWNHTVKAKKPTYALA